MDLKSHLYRTKKLFDNIPQNSEFIYRICKRYVDQYNGESNCNINSNGELFFLKRNLSASDVVFDVGANIGEWSKLALDVNNKIELHCFEPSKYSFRKLLNNNFPSNVHCNNFGLGSKKELRTLYIFDNGSGLNSLYQRHGLENIGLAPQQKEEQVPIDTLDSYCNEKKIDNIDFLKIDVEGHELEVFKGARNMLQKEKVKIIQFEYGGCNIDAKVFLNDIFEFFEGSNYSFYKIYPKNIRYIERYDQRLDNFQYSNYLIIRKNYKYF